MLIKGSRSIKALMQLKEFVSTIYGMYAWKWRCFCMKIFDKLGNHDDPQSSDYLYPHPV